LKPLRPSHQHTKESQMSNSFFNMHSSQISSLPLPAAISAANMLPKVEPHAARLESIADDMEAAGIGGDPNNGHAIALRRMAGQMRADAAQGRMPSSIHAAAEPKATPLTGALRACAEAGIEVPAGGKFTLETLNAALDDALDKNHPVYMDRRFKLKNQIFAAGLVVEEQVIDTKAIKIAAAMLRQAGIPAPSTHAFTLSEINAELAKTALSPQHKIEIKLALAKAHLLEDAVATVAPQRPNITMARSIFAQLELDPPPAGQKVGLGTLAKAVREKGVAPEKAMQIKASLHALGLLAD
jgi:hypothetical protein